MTLPLTHHKSLIVQRLRTSFVEETSGDIFKYKCW